MRTKIYLNDWFYNCGIIGFLKILEHDEKQFAVKRNNYIEIDTEDLRDFNKCYFKYFFDKYNVAKNVKSRTEKGFEYLENNIETVLENNEEEKQRKDKIKSNKNFKNMIITSIKQKQKYLKTSSFLVRTNTAHQYFDLPRVK